MTAFLSCSDCDFAATAAEHFASSKTEISKFADLAATKGFTQGQSLVLGSTVEAVVFGTEAERLLCEAKLVMAIRKEIAKTTPVSGHNNAEIADDSEEDGDGDEDDDAEEIDEILSSVQWFSIPQFLELPTIVNFKGKFVLFSTTGYHLVTSANFDNIKEQLATVGSKGVVQGFNNSYIHDLSTLMVVHSDQTTKVLAQAKVARFASSLLQQQDDDDSGGEELVDEVDAAVTFVKEDDFVFSLSRALEAAEQNTVNGEEADDMPPPCFDGDDEEAPENDEEEEEGNNEDNDDGTAAAGGGGSGKGDQWEVDAEAMLEQYVEALLGEPQDATHWYNLGLALEQVTSDRKEEQQQRRGQGGKDQHDEDHAPAVTINDEIGDVTEADCYVKAVQYDPKLSDAWYNLGRVLMGYSSSSESGTTMPEVTIPGVPNAVNEVECLRRAVETNKVDDGQCWCNLGDALFRHKVYAGVSVAGKVVASVHHAQSCATYALKKDSTNFVAWNNLGDTIWESATAAPTTAAASSSSSADTSTPCPYEKTVTVNGRAVNSAQECYLKSLSFETGIVDVWANLRKTMKQCDVAVVIPGSSKKLKASDVDRTIKRLKEEGE